MLLLRAMYLSTHKLFPEALAETRELVSQLETFVETYNINEETDEIIGKPYNFCYNKHYQEPFLEVHLKPRQSQILIREGYLF